MSLNIESLKFVIFGNGHDYTLLDSGDGDTQVFSHPFVPLNSTHYAGQWYFIVPDENGEPIDPIKDDIAHCTFTPAIGATFDTEGEIEVKCHYHREYIYPESTIVVDKEVKQTIEVVDHGSVVSSSGTCDLYTDGYLFFRPSTVFTAISEKMFVYSPLNGTKVSSIPWRVTELGNNTGYAFVSAPVTDIEELQYADTSNVTAIYNLLNGNALENLDPLGGWDVSKVERIYRLSFGSSTLKDISGVLKWQTLSLERIDSILENNTALTSLHGFEDWNVSKVWDMSGMCRGDTALNDISALTNWKTDNLETLYGAFDGDSSLEDITGLSNFNVSKLNDLRYFMRSCGVRTLEPLSTWDTPKLRYISYAWTYCVNLTNYKGLENLDVSHVENFREVFHGNENVESIEGVEPWQTLSATTFQSTFGRNIWNNSIKPIEGWTFPSGCTAKEMLQSCNNLLSVDDVDLDLSGASDISNMFSTFPMYWSQLLGRKVYYVHPNWYDRNGIVTDPVQDIDHPVVEYTKDASYAQNWVVNGTGLGAFDSNWSNRPTWN